MRFLDLTETELGIPQARVGETVFRRGLNIFRPFKQYAEREGATEGLKTQEHISWVRRMSGIRERVEEAILQELICA